MFWCERETPCSPTLFPNPYFIPYESYLWHPREPGNVALTVQVPTPGENGELDLFCGGHTFTTDGRVVAAGGQDHVETCLTGTTVGTRGMFLFDNVLADGIAPEPAWHRLSDMLRARWYATMTRGADGRITLAGHQYDPPGTNPPTQMTRERFLIADGSMSIQWDPIEAPTDLDFLNYTAASPLALTCVGGTPLIGMRGYPRVEAIHDPTNGTDLVTLSAFPDLPPAYQPVSSYYLDYQACESLHLEEERWMLGHSGPPPIAFTVAHLFDMTTPTPTEVIYSMGGDNPADAGANPFDVDDCDNFTNRVVKLVNPSLDSMWDGAAQGVPQLIYGRKHMQVVIGLDGALYVIGGQGKRVINPPDPNPCLRLHHPERYAPPEIFASPSSAWSLLQAHAHDRAHHSVAGLLEDGRMYSAGGDRDNDEPTSPGERSVELYSPLYLFKGPRPVIRTIDDLEPIVGDTLNLEVEISGSATGEFRVALLSPGSMTHGYNPSQRYLKLRVLSPAPGSQFNSPPVLTPIQVEIPSDPQIVLPGYYLITVVRQNGVPSVGKWIRVKLQ
jgi:hypothetical protein